VVTKVGDGFRGWPEHAPFDKIIVTCSPEDIPRPLVEQLAEGGRMIIPVGERYDQALVLLTKRAGEMVRETLVPTLFVPMTGTAETARKVQPDPTRPALENGGFEKFLDGSKEPVAWYYGRQFEIVADDEAREGKRFLRLENGDAGRPAQVFQGFPVDGRKIGRLSLTAALQAEGIRIGLAAEESPAFVVRFFDEGRSRSSKAPVAIALGTFPWKTVSGTVPVPVWAREAIVQIGMLGATGRLEVDDVRIEGIPRE